MKEMFNILYKSAALLFRLFFKIFCRWEIRGRENIPETGRLVIMANHITYLDPPIIGALIKRRTHFMAKKELFRVPVLGYLLKKIGQIPVKRGSPDRSALKQALAILEEEKVLGIFPEGTTRRSEEHTSELQSRPHLVCRLLL